MKQLLQDARTGDLKIAEVPPPQLLPGCVLVRVAASLVSAGTERASAEFASKNLAAKAKARPDLVRDVMPKMKRDGLASTMQTVRSRLDQPQSLGYSSAGVVIAVGDGVSSIAVGDRVACAGAGYAPSMPSLPVSLECCWRRFPRTRSSKILCKFLRGGGLRNSRSDLPARHPHRQSRPGRHRRGDRLGVARTNHGAVVEGRRLSRLWHGSVAPACRSRAWKRSRGRLCTARVNSATLLPENRRCRCGLRADYGRGSSSEPVNLAAELPRDRAIVVAVGTVGMELQRKLYYKKNWIFEFRAPMAPAVTTLRMSRRDAIIRLAKCAGPKRATSKPFCNLSWTAN